jgi:eukaryotic-like serine/threonine-protein kinase
MIGSGGMGMVWAAFDPDLERAVAVKLLHADSSEPTLRSRLLREARAMARLRHPNVVTVFDVGTDQNRDYIAMELIEGTTLDAWFDTKPSQHEIVVALLAAGKGLAAAHAAGLVHRDFKPHNVLRANDGHIYVTDFGLARGQIEEGPEVVQVPVAATALDSGKRSRDSVLDSPLTQTGVLIGTPAYMAPEQFAGRAPDPKSDQFAFCVTAWEALTGARPFRGATLEELEAAARGGVSGLSTDLPPPIHDVLARGLDPHPEARWPDLTSLLSALSQAVADPVVPKPRRWSPIALIAAVVIGGGGITAFLLLRHGSASDSGCVPAEEAFAAAWGPARRDELRSHNPEAGIGVLIILDQLKREWTRKYTKACEAPASPERESRIKCLLSARDNSVRTIDRLMTKDREVDMSEPAGLTAEVMMCDPDAMRGPMGPMPPEIEHDDDPDDDDGEPPGQNTPPPRPDPWEPKPRK